MVLLVQILVVDDEKYMRQITCRILGELGYRYLLEAEDGASALRLMTARDNIGLVILDIEMPNLGGLDFLRMIRRAETVSVRSVPVIMLSGNSNYDNLKKAAELGIHGFLAKPVSKANLDKQIKRALISPALDPTKLTVPS